MASETHEWNENSDHIVLYMDIMGFKDRVTRMVQFLDSIIIASLGVIFYTPYRPLRSNSRMKINVYRNT